jgi:hypothetical protein
MTLLTNPFAHLQGSLIRVTPRGWRFDFKKDGIEESPFTALLVRAPNKPGSTGSFKTCIFYKGSLYEFYIYPDEVSSYS